MNKKFNITLLGTAVVCATIFTSSVFAATGKVTGKSVRLREEANTKSSILETISKNTEVEVLSEEENWYKVSYKDKEGYIHKDYLKVEEEKVEETTTIEESNSEEIENAEENIKEEKIELGDKITTNSKVYLTACYSASEIGNVDKGTIVKLEKTIGNWTCISTDSVYGWVPNYKLIKTENEEPEKVEEKKEEKKIDKKKTTAKKINKKAYLSSNSANLRKGPGTNYEVIGGVAKYEVLTVISEEDGWYKVKTSDGTEGYVLKTLITLGERKTTSRSDERETAIDTKEDKKEDKKEEKKTENKTEETKKEETKTEEKKETTTSSADAKRKELVAYAKKYLGYKYVHGGSKPSTGFDCSGFTKYVYGKFGYTLARTSSAQAKNGTAVKKSDLKVGDLLIFTGHVGIYIGNNKFIHASNPQDGVKITSLSDSYYVKNYKGARRIIK